MSLFLNEIFNKEIIQKTKEIIIPTFVIAISSDWSTIKVDTLKVNKQFTSIA